MKKYRIIHIPTGEFFDAYDYEIPGDAKSPISNIVYVAHRAYPNEKCIAIKTGCFGCPWDYESAKERSLEYFVEEIE